MSPIVVRAGGPVLVAALTAGLLLFRPATPAAAQPPAAAPELALVPADAAGFVHVRLADIWKNDMFAQMRKTWERAGPRALAALDTQFVPAPSSLSRATAFMLIDKQKPEPFPFGILTFSAPFDADLVVKTYLPDAEKKQVNGKTVYVDANLGAAVHFPNRTNILVGTPDGMTAYLAKPPATDGPLAGPLKIAASGKPVVAAGDLSGLPIPDEVLKDIPVDVKPLLKAQQLVIVLDLGADAKVEVKAVFKDAADAAAAEKAIQAMAEEGRKELAKARKEIEDKLYDPNNKAPRPPDQLGEAIGQVFTLGALNRLDDLLADTDFIKRTGTELAVTVPMPKELVAVLGGAGAVGAAFLLPAARKWQAPGGRTTAQNNLKQLALGVLNYESTYQHYPEAGAVCDKAGNPLLSWRVAILPYIEQDALYRQFKLDEPWDGPANKKLIDKMPPVYMTPNAPTEPGKTYYKVPRGPGAMFEAGKKTRIAEVTDGTSNTILIVEGGDPVVWTKPDEFDFDPKKPLPKLALPGRGDVVNVVMADGSVRKLNLKTIKEASLKAAFTRAGGEVPDLDK